MGLIFDPQDEDPEKSNINMHYYIILLIVFAGFSACKKAPKHETVLVAEEKPKPVVAGDCYLLVSGKDSILMQMVVENNTAAGQLHYRFYEKDKSGGKIFGNMKGDTLIADYKYISAGMETEREVAFLKRGDAFVEGIGDTENREGRMVFSDTRSITFGGQPLQITDCEVIARYFKK